MAEQGLDIRIPRQSIIYMVLCLTGILLFIFGGIVPNIGKLSDLDQEAATVRFQLEEQRALAPLYQTLREKSEMKESNILPLPTRGKLAQDKIGTLPSTFSIAAKTCEMSLASAIPNLSDMTGDAQALSVNVVLRGELGNFRKFLINLGAIPYVQHIEEISIQQKSDAKEFRLKIWVAIG